MSIKDKLLAFIREEEGLTTVEYAIAGGLIGVAIVAAFTDLGEAIADKIDVLIGYLA